MANEWGSSATTPENRDINCGSFWPVISSAKFYEVYRIPAELPESTVMDYLRQAIVRVIEALAEWKIEQTAAGYAALAAVPQDQIDGFGKLVLLWERAVYCEAKAELLKETETVERKDKAENAAKTGPETEAKYREWAADALRSITGMKRISIELL